MSSFQFVFPTGIDRCDDLGTPDRFDVYYGKADSRIGVARINIPETLPPERSADPPEATRLRALPSGSSISSISSISSTARTP